MCVMPSSLPSPSVSQGGGGEGSSGKGGSGGGGEGGGRKGGGGEATGAPSSPVGEREGAKPAIGGARREAQMARGEQRFDGNATSAGAGEPQRVRTARGRRCGRAKGAGAYRVSVRRSRAAAARAAPLIPPPLFRSPLHSILKYVNAHEQYMKYFMFIHISSIN